MVDDSSGDERSDGMDEDMCVCHDLDFRVLNTMSRSCLYMQMLVGWTWLQLHRVGELHLPCCMSRTDLLAARTRGFPAGIRYANQEVTQRR